MKNRTDIEIPENEKKQVKENSEVDYWSKKYDISKEDLKNKKINVGIYDKIIESYLQNAR
ncbi:hypothetical protein [Mucilaginibacter gotjawali]|uniref:Uncharacterized protein n=2 Tax=Mucilaginibacter gotjawali TaxID=1550579 RepID=A0A0X8X531_9SPHI|nr:hypothetical protein [Mucilaginibacter gotjawali]MBB3058521.1 hypothetical protein [Mucilaginibacter gotjawali]BAU55745.1 hypothetical protein MgSA37_03937 [Mucilaginibacter gotjawali]